MFRFSRLYIQVVNQTGGVSVFSFLPSSFLFSFFLSSERGFGIQFGNLREKHIIVGMFLFGFAFCSPDPQSLSDCFLFKGFEVVLRAEDKII